MSKKSSLSNSKETARNYVQFLSSIEGVDKVFLAGSRSPNHYKDPHSDSDWDFVAVSEVPNFHLPHPRSALKIMHADLITVTAEAVSYVPHAVEVWPIDTHGVLA